MLSAAAGADAVRPGAAAGAAGAAVARLDAHEAQPASVSHVFSVQHAHLCFALCFRFPAELIRVAGYYLQVAPGLGRGPKLLQKTVVASVTATGLLTNQMCFATSGDRG